ncbi:MAG: hypothetical protein ACRDWV_00320 [Acidimicrobiales bacterium]
MSDDVIALFETVVDGADIKALSEKHYRLVPGGDIPASRSDDASRFREPRPRVPRAAPCGRGGT